MGLGMGLGSEEGGVESKYSSGVMGGILYL